MSDDTYLICDAPEERCGWEQAVTELNKRLEDYISNYEPNTNTTD